MVAGLPPTDGAEDAEARARAWIHSAVDSVSQSSRHD